MTERMLTMSKELINEIESKIAWNDKRISETDVSLRDVKRLLNELEKQVELVGELGVPITKMSVARYKDSEELDEIHRQNKRYREAIERAVRHLKNLKIEDGANFAYLTLIKALEADEQ